MKRGHTYTSPIQPNYESGPLPYEAPARPLRSYQELAAIEKARDYFYDKDGRPNENWRRFTACVSLLDFPKPNLNSASQDVLAALGRYDQMQSRSVVDFLQGKGDFRYNGPGYFQNAGDVGRITGPTGDPQGFSTTISALRINLTVREARNEFRVSVVVAPPGGAKTVQTIATKKETKAATGTSAPGAPPAGPTAAAPAPASGLGSAAATKPADLKYPYTVLSIEENPAAAGSPPAGG
jgi:general secretion pathway protein K